MRFFCRFETPSEIPANYLAGNFSELYAPVLQRETTHENSTFELASPSVRLFAIPSLRKMELSFVICIIVLGIGYIAFPVAQVVLAVFNKLIE